MKRASPLLLVFVLIVSESCLEPVDPVTNPVFDVYPNPARETARIIFQVWDEPGTLQVVDAKGEIILDTKVETGDISHYVNLVDSPDGKCHVFFKTRSSTFERTFMKISR